MFPFVRWMDFDTNHAAFWLHEPGIKRYLCNYVDAVPSTDSRGSLTGTRPGAAGGEGDGRYHESR